MIPSYKTAGDQRFTSGNRRGSQTPSTSGEGIINVRKPSSKPGPSLEGCAGAVVGFTLTYLAAEAILPGSLHPVHWGATLLGAGLGYAIGQAVSRYKVAPPRFRPPRGRH